MFYKGYRKNYEFTRFKTVSSFGDAIKKGFIVMYIASNEQNQLSAKSWELSKEIKTSRPIIEIKRGKKY